MLEKKKYTKKKKMKKYTIGQKFEDHPLDLKLVSFITFFV